MFHNFSKKRKRKKKKKTKTTRLPIGDGQFYGIIYLFSLFSLLYFIKLKKGSPQGFFFFFLKLL
jgi:hypothetical protein